VAVGGVQLELLLADAAAPGHGEQLNRGERQRAATFEIELLVEGPQLSLCGAGLGAQALGGALGAAQRRLRKCKRAEQVIPVGMGRQQTVRRRKGRLLDQRRQQLELFRQDRRIDDERLPAPGSAAGVAGLRSSAAGPRMIVQFTWSSWLVTTSTSRWSEMAFMRAAAV